MKSATLPIVLSEKEQAALCDLCSLPECNQMANTKCKVRRANGFAFWQQVRKRQEEAKRINEIRRRKYEPSTNQIK